MATQKLTPEQMKALKRVVAMLDAVKPHVNPKMSNDARLLLRDVLGAVHADAKATLEPAPEQKPKTKLRLVR